MAVETDLFPFWRFAGVSAGVLLLLFIIYTVIVSFQAGQAVEAMPLPPS